MIKKEVEKILKYKDLITEIQCVGNVTAGVIPVIIGVTGTISESINAGKVQCHGTTENSHIGHCTLTAGSANVRVENIFPR